MDGEAIRLVPRGHVFATDEFGKIDMWAWDGEYHNGPICVICNDAFCHHCDTNWRSELCPRYQEELPGLEFELETEYEKYDPHVHSLKAYSIQISVSDQ
jgi:hypothetical protein